ncbi:MAG: hypothetical protein FD157_2078 [Rhodocyclaceae bacterium]|nr:MAG: hypothetical protein FD157_2078 [Rhodocyclaceae bacterium]TND01346.1 MAG: hypothetical protein FD118_2494 [Rhodocyclaceae bacterium]
MEDPKNLILILSVAIAAVMLWRAIRRREFARPALVLGLGPEARTRRRSGIARGEERPELLLAQGVDPETVPPYLFMVPLLIQNKGRDPAKNLVVQLEYPAEFRVVDLKKRLERFGLDARNIEQDEVTRGVVTASSRTIVRYSITTLRPGESRVLAEPVLVVGGVATPNISSLTAFNACSSSDLPESLLSLFPFRVFLFSDNTDAVESDGLVFYVRSQAAPDVSQSLDIVLTALSKAHPRLTLVTLFGRSLLRLVKRPVLTTKPKYQTRSNVGTVEIPDVKQEFRNYVVRIPSRHDLEPLWSF